MATNLQPISSDGGFTSGGNINSSGDPSSAPSLNDFFSITSAANFAIVTDNANTDQTWTFDDAGNLTLPGNTFAVNYANGTQVSIGGGSGNTGNVTFDDVTVQGVNQLNLSAGADFTANLAYLQVRSGDVASHIHLDTGNNEAYDLIIGDDDKFVQVSSTGNIIMSSYDGNASSTWTFDTTGNLNLPLSSVVYETNIPDQSLSGSAIALKPAGGTTANQQLLIYPTAFDGDHIHMTSGNLYATELFLGSDNFYVKLANTGNVVINSNDGNSSNAMWTFGTDGNLTLPGNTFAVNYANGTQVSIGGGNANTGNVTFSDQIVIGTGSNDGTDGLYLAPGNNSIANSALQYLRVRGGDVVTHIHLDTGNNQFYDQYFGDDAKYVKLELGDAGNVVIGTDDANGNQYNWSFTSDGNLILAGGNSVIQSIANSSSEPLYPNVSTMVFTPDALLSSQSLVLDPTGPSHIHLRAPGANIDEPDANIFLGGEESSFEVGYYNGAAPNLFVHSGGNTWTFDTTGILVFPRDNGPNTTDPILTITGGANPKILSEDASLAGPANLEIAALNTIFTGSSGSAIKIYPDDGEVASDGNLQIWANSGGNTEYSWTFDTTGNLTVPGNLVIAGNTSVFGTNASLIAPAGNLPLLSVSSGSNGGVSSLWVEDIGNVGTSNIAAVYVNPTSGSGIVRIAVGQNGGAGGPNLWDFDNAGNLTLPTSGHIIVSGGIVGGGASPAPTLSGFSSVSALQFTNGNSNVTVNSNSNLWTFDSTGNLIIPGSSGGFIKTVANASIGIAAVDNGTNNPAQLLSMTNAGAATSIVSAYATNATIQTNATGTINTWQFDSAGNLTLPGNAVAIKFANGSAAFGNIATINLNGNTSQVLLGNGAFATIPSSSIISNGNSNVSIATSNGNVTIAAVGNTTMTVTGTGANVNGTLTSTGKIGYASGSTVTQTTNRGNGVTINALAGTIITTSASMVANQIDTFSVANDQVDPNNDIVLVQIVSPNFGVYNCIAQPSATISSFLNGFYINIQNISGFTTSSDAITIRFMVIKAPNA